MSYGEGLGSSATPLASGYDVALLDLDGVVYLGAEAVPGVAAHLDASRRLGLRTGFVTNNASRSPTEVAAHLDRLGITATPDDVVTSAQAAARLARERLSEGDPVLVLGTSALRDAVEAAGLRVVDSADDSPAAVVQGLSQQMTYAALAEAGLALDRGAVWVACNTDTTLPTTRGPLPGNGALVAALRAASGREPLVAGKPAPALHRESLLRTGARRPLVVGDRLDTDILGAVAAGCDSLLVLTGVTSAAALLAAVPGERPTYVARTLAGLLTSHPVPEVVTALDGVTVTCGCWRVRATAAALALELSEELPDPVEDPDDALRALCTAAWTMAAVGCPPGRVEAGSSAGEGALAALGLTSLTPAATR